MAQSKTYSVVRQKDGSYGVEIIEPQHVPRVVGDFSTAQEAESWIAEQKVKDLPPVADEMWERFERSLPRNYRDKRDDD